jgi:hypothetical protein
MFSVLNSVSTLKDPHNNSKDHLRDDSIGSSYEPCVDSRNDLGSQNKGKSTAHRYNESEDDLAKTEEIN